MGFGWILSEGELISLQHSISVTEEHRRMYHSMDQKKICVFSFTWQIKTCCVKPDKLSPFILSLFEPNENRSIIVNFVFILEGGTKRCFQLHAETGQTVLWAGFCMRSDSLKCLVTKRGSRLIQTRGCTFFKSVYFLQWSFLMIQRKAKSQGTKNPKIRGQEEMVHPAGVTKLLIQSTTKWWWQSPRVRQDLS